MIFIDSLVAYEKKCLLQVYLDNCAYKTVNTEMVGYLDDNLLELNILVL